MAVSRKKRFVIAILSAIVLSAAIALLLIPQEPKYKGATAHEWLQRPIDEQQATALLNLGTNNLSLFVRRITYDPRKDKVLRLYAKLPRPLVKPAERFVLRKSDLAVDALLVLQQLGPMASPAIPQIVNLATNGNPVDRLLIVRKLAHKASPAIPGLIKTATPAIALNSIGVLEDIGDKAVPALIALSGSTNGQTARLALESLAKRKSSPEVQKAFANALRHPSPSVRIVAQTFFQ
jgi:hypothetical protein